MVKRVLRPALLMGLVVLPSFASSYSSSKPTARTDYYVSLGDSYAVGYQPAPREAATSGYTAVVARATHLTLANFGCAGATTASILETKGCRGRYGPAAVRGAVAYSNKSQAAAAQAFIRSHHGHIGLITITIGGNDITNCGSTSNVVPCFTSAISAIQKDVATLASGLRSAAGTRTPIIGLTYPDVLLGSWVYPPSAPNHNLASLSVTVFKNYINPALMSAYAKSQGHFVDITAATGAYTPLTETATQVPYGTIPKAVAQVCNLTWYCTRGSIHANTAGYKFIGQQVVAEYNMLRAS